MFPVTIIDDFFPDPDSIVEMASSTYPYEPDPTGKWPGVRSKQLHTLDTRLFSYIGRRIFSVFGSVPPEWRLSASFQKIKPFSENKWDRRNRGWVHNDGPSMFFGGIIYLNKNADKDTGTSIYKAKRGFALPLDPEEQIKRDLYTGKDIHLPDYEKLFDDYHDQFVETIKVDNIYNRLLLFSQRTLHGVRTFGTKERLTLPFFCRSYSNTYTPPFENFPHFWNYHKTY